MSLALGDLGSQDAQSNTPNTKQQKSTPTSQRLTPSFVLTICIKANRRSWLKTVQTGCDNKDNPPWPPNRPAEEFCEGSVALKTRGYKARTLAAGAGLALMLALSGCGAFFQCEGKTSCGTGSGGTGIGDYVYVSNSVTGSTYLDGFQVSSGSLVTATGSPYSLQYVPTTMVITPSNKYLYIGNGTTPGNIYGYSLATGGAITILNSGNGLVQENSASLDISPDGQWLFSLNTNGLTLEEYQISSTTGLLTYVNNYTIAGAPNATIAPLSVKVAPSGDFVVCALGQGGADIFSLTTSTGALGTTPLTNFNQLLPPNLTSGIYAVAIDANNNIYTSATAGLEVFSATSVGAPSSKAISLTSPAGSGPGYSLALDGTSSVYAASESASNNPVIYGFVISSSNPLASTSGSPNVAPTGVGAIGRDSSGDYLVAAGYNATGGIQLFSIGSGGALSSIGSQASGITTSVPVVMALTH